LVLYIDGDPLIVDAGVETYTRKTFGPQRYEIWTMQSAFHSLLPSFDGVMQQAGLEYAARDVSHSADDAGAVMSLDIAAAYPADGRPVSWQRTVSLRRGREVTVTDRYELSRPAAEITLGILTPSEVKVRGSGRIAFSASALPDDRSSAPGVLAFEGAPFEVSVQEVPISDARLAPIWGGRLRRVLFRVAGPALRGIWTWRVSRA
jgi:hypothetical protein